MSQSQEVTHAASPSPLAAMAGPSKVVLEARKKFNMHMEDELLDYKHNHPIHIESCANTLIKIFTNVLEHPDEDKYRKVKCTSNTYKSTVANVRGGDHLMLLAGWREQVIELQKYWVFDGPEGSAKFSILHECVGVLNKAIGTIHEKAERKRKEMEGKAAMEKERKEKIMAALEDDKLERRMRSEMTALSGPVPACPLPSEAAKQATPGAKARGGAKSHTSGQATEDDDE